MWNFVDLFYRNQGQENTGYVTDAFLARIARGAGVPPNLVVKSATKNAALERPLQQAEAEAQAAGQTATPAFLIGPRGGQGKVLSVDRLDIGAFTAAIDPELK
jgi:protein-disulfide isomerase